MSPVDAEAAERLAAAWTDALNRRDLDAALELYAPDAVIASDGIARLVPGSDGVLHGREELRGYWRAVLERSPDARLTVTSVYAGPDTVLVLYRNEVGARIGELLVLRDGRVVRAYGTRRLGPERDPGSEQRLEPE